MLVTKIRSQPNSRYVLPQKTVLFLPFSNNNDIISLEMFYILRSAGKIFVVGSEDMQNMIFRIETIFLGLHGVNLKTFYCMKFYDSKCSFP